MILYYSAPSRQCYALDYVQEHEGEVPSKADVYRVLSSHFTARKPKAKLNLIAFTQNHRFSTLLYKAELHIFELRERTTEFA